MIFLRKFLSERFPQGPLAVLHYESLLRDYYVSGFAAPNLEDELKTRDDHKLWSAIWEALLYQHFKSLGFTFKESRTNKHGQNGPDLGLIYSGKTIWIEAIVPKPIGIPEDCLTTPAFPTARTEPHEQKLLRWTAAIKEKKERFALYLEDGVVSPEDCAVIAVNSCCLQDFAFDDTGISQLPYVVEATLPIGPLEVSINHKGERVAPPHHTWRPFLTNHNGSDVPTASFLREDYCQVSAALGSHQRDMHDHPLHLSLVHNPRATNPLPKQIFSAAREYTCAFDHTGLTLQRHPKDSPP